MSLPPEEQKRERVPIPGAAEYAGLGLQFAGAILLFLFTGRWLDEKLGTGPWLLMLGVFMGFGLSLYLVQRRLRGGRNRPGSGDR
jgi:F0F1-type ATP synthase assembly protein I